MRPFTLVSALFLFLTLSLAQKAEAAAVEVSSLPEAVKATIAKEALNQKVALRVTDESGKTVYRLRFKGNDGQLYIATIGEDGTLIAKDPDGPIRDYGHKKDKK